MKNAVIALACLLVLSACGSEPAEDSLSETSALEDLEPVRDEDEPSTSVHMLVAACDGTYVELDAQGQNVSHPVAVFAVPVESIRSAWACDPEPSDQAGPEGCLGVLPFVTSGKQGGQIVVPCESDSGERYREARLIIEY